MNAVRYYLALIMVVSLAPRTPRLAAHPPLRPLLAPGGARVDLRRRRFLVGLAMAGLFLRRHDLLAVEFGTNYYLTALGLVLLAASSWLGLVWFRRMRLTTIMGLPELAPERHPQQLITTGVYAIIRHPRYVQVIWASWAAPSLPTTWSFTWQRPSGCPPSMP